MGSFLGSSSANSLGNTVTQNAGDSLSATAIGGPGPGPQNTLARVNSTSIQTEPATRSVLIEQDDGSLSVVQQSLESTPGPGPFGIHANTVTVSATDPSRVNLSNRGQANNSNNQSSESDPSGNIGVNISGSLSSSLNQGAVTQATHNPSN